MMVRAAPERRHNSHVNYSSPLLILFMSTDETFPEFLRLVPRGVAATGVRSGRISNEFGEPAQNPSKLYCTERFSRAIKISRFSTGVIA
jgi:hypothetical protein